MLFEKSKVNSIMRFLLQITLLAVLSSCSGGSRGGSSNGTTSTQVINNSAGGVMMVSNKADPIFGASVTIPSNSLTTAQETISITSSSTLPGPLNNEAILAGTKAVSRTIVLNKSNPYTFSLPVTVHIPYDKAALGETDIPTALYWDDANNKYEALKIVAIDRTNGTIDYVTTHFSSSFISTIPGTIDALKSSVYSPILATDTAFNFSVDGFVVKNFSTQHYPSSHGACYGLSAYASWYFTDKKSKGAPPLSEKYVQSTSLTEANELAREVIDKTYDITYKTNVITTNQEFNFIHSQSKLDADLWSAANIIQSLIITKSPQMVSLFVPNPSGNGYSLAHSVLVTSFDPILNQFNISDPNTPGFKQVIAWSPTNGFLPYYPFTEVGFEAFSSFFNKSELESIYQKAESGWDNYIFHSIAVQTNLDSNGTIYALDNASTIVTATSTVNALGIAHVFIDNMSLDYFFLSSSSFAFNLNTFQNILNKPFAKDGSELIIVIANSIGINDGYEGFYKAKIRVVSPDHIKLTANTTTLSLNTVALLEAKAFADIAETIPLKTSPADYTWNVVTTGGGTVDFSGYFAPAKIGLVTISATYTKLLSKTASIDILVTGFTNMSTGKI